jgi:hypothetical protein
MQMAGTRTTFPSTPGTQTVLETSLGTYINVLAYLTAHSEYMYAEQM